MTVAMLIAALVLAGALLFMGYYWSTLRPRKGTLDWVELEERKPLTFAVPRHPMERKDTLPILFITAVYAFTAFFSLGSFSAPQETMDFADGQSYTIEIQGEPIYISKVWSYSALGTGAYNLELSKDGQHWSTLWTRTEQDQWGRDKTVYYWAEAEGYEPSYALSQNYVQLFKWAEIAPENPQYAQYIRITGRADKDLLQLAKLIFLDHNDQKLTFEWTVADGSPMPRGQLFSLDDTVPETISWRNSAYFDEIYHPRTALEHIQGVYPYEITHPPLGKLIIGLGVRAFGMTAFGWRCMGALFGVLMVPLFYVLVKNMFGRTNLAVCGTVLLASEFMHLTQTRIATIDTYGVFFILLSYLFFYRWLTASATPGKDGKPREGYGQLCLSGVFWGVGCACKWTVIYAGAGLAVIYLIHMILRLRAWDRSETGPKIAPWLCKTLAVSVASFVVIPVCIYVLSYIPYAQAAGHPTLAGLLDEVWRNQTYMLTYHQGVHSTHPYSSRWYQWLVDARPILYYSKDLGGGLTERFAAFNNPLIVWTGLLALFTCLARCFRRMQAKLALMWSAGLGCALICFLVGRVENGDFDPALSTEDLTARLVLMGVCLAIYLAAATLIALQTEKRSSGRDVFLAIGFAAQFLPWVCIGRITFAYHYFPSTLFLILALCAVFDDMMGSKRCKWKAPVYGFTAASATLYAMFYPALTGLTMPVWYSSQVLKLLPSWPI